jgi:hypothetical protein
MAYKDPLDERARAARRKHYYANKEQYYARNKEKKNEIKRRILEIKNTTPCTDCQQSFVDEPWLLEFDHVRGEKKFNISTMHNRGSLRLLEEELAKCDLVCVMCHRRRSAQRGNWGVIENVI